MEPGHRPFPKELCKLCHRKFFGDNCYNGHLQRRSKNIRSICDTYKKCPNCCHVYKNDDNPRNPNFDQHVCGEGECQYCEKKVDLASHLCYIQRLKKGEDDPKFKKVDVDDVRGRPYILDEKDGRAWVERDTHCISIATMRV